MGVARRTSTYTVARAFRGQNLLIRARATKSARINPNSTVRADRQRVQIRPSRNSIQNLNAAWKPSMVIISRCSFQPFPPEGAPGERMDF